MEKKALISIFCQVYNTPEEYLRKCIESVLLQTYPEFELHILDNGCTDGSNGILREYAQRDSRICLTVVKENLPIWRYNIVASNITGEYYVHIDADDWWEPNYLEHLLFMMRRYQLDIVCTGNDFYQGETITGVRRVQQVHVIERDSFAEKFPFYHQFFRVAWGKMMRREFIIGEAPRSAEVSYGSDTLKNFFWLRNVRRIGIDPSVLYHYRQHAQSKSYVYNGRRIDSDVVLYEDAVDFLRVYGPISERNQRFLHAVYANAVTDTVRVIDGARLPPAEKLRECRRIAEHPITQAAYKRRDDSSVNSRMNLLRLTLNSGLGLEGEDDTDLRETIKALLPHCGGAVTAKTLTLFRRERPLLDALIADDWEALTRGLLELIDQKKYIKQYDLGAILHSLIPQTTPLYTAKDTRFFREHGEICRLLMYEDRAAALDHMTGTLLYSDGLYGEESFLRIYLSLAALESQVPAFLFGNIRLAALYLREGRREECRAVLDELTEMGAGEHEEVITLREKLGNIS